MSAKRNTMVNSFDKSGPKHSYITLRLDGLQVSIGISLQLEQYEKFITRHIHTSVLSNPRSQGACHM